MSRVINRETFFWKGGETEKKIRMGTMPGKFWIDTSDGHIQKGSLIFTAI